LDFPAADATHADGVLLAARVPDHGPYFVTRDRPAPLWFYGGVLPGGNAYFWAKYGPGHVDSTLSVRVEVRGDDPWAGQRAAWRTTTAALGAWPLILQACRREFSGGSHDDLAELWLSTIPTAMNMLAAACAALPPVERIVVDADRRAAVAHECGEHVSALCAGLLDCALHAACHVGVTALIEAQGREEANEAFAEATPCTCGDGQVWGRRSSIAGGKVRDRVEMLCDACGALDVDDGRHVAMLASFDRRVVRGGELKYTLRCSAPPAEHLYVAHAGLLEPWIKTDAPSTSVSQRLVLGPGAAVESGGRLGVPSAIVPGLHRLTILSVSNGVLALARRSIEVV
jgi:hypothetical protein